MINHTANTEGGTMQAADQAERDRKRLARDREDERRQRFARWARQTERRERLARMVIR
jgi:hypothetical protein